MNADSTFEIIKIILPAIVVFLTAYYTIKSFLDAENKRRNFTIKQGNQSIITPLRLQAYERIILFLERINPSSIIMRLPKVGTAIDFETEVIKTIRSEYEHNLSQQTYMSVKAWEHVVTAKEETMKLLQVASANVDKQAAAIDLAQSILLISSQLTQLPNKDAIDFIKKEIAKEF